MAPARARLFCRFWIAIALCVAGGAGAAVSPAHAGTYEVMACDAAPGGVNNSWFATKTLGMTAFSDCPTERQSTRGITAASALNAGSIPLFSKALMAFDAPAGTTIEQLRTQFAIHRADDYWDIGFLADGHMLLGCHANDVGNLCFYDTSWPGVTKTISVPGAHRLYIQAACERAAGCLTQALEQPFSWRTDIHVFSAVVRVRDDTAPRVTGVDGAIVNGGWLAGSHYVGHSASDNTGISSTALYVDGRKVDDRTRDCDYTRPLPCSDVSYGRYLFNTRSLPDGVHQYRVEARDAAGNVGSFAGEIQADNTAPGAPTDVAVDGGEDWRRTNGFRVHWTNPDSAAPITVARYSLCNTATSTCTSGLRRGDGIGSIDDLNVPDPGDYTLRVWLEDAAGNVDWSNSSAAVHLRFDDVAPGEAKPRDHDGWVNAREAHAFDQVIDLKDGEARPVSGIAGYSVTTDGTDPDGTLDLVGGTYHINDLPEGVTTIKARAISGSGVPSDRVGEATLRVDKTPPGTAVHGAPGQASWSRAPVAFDVVGLDQPDLSGMTPAPDTESIEKGAYVEYAIDGGERRRFRGGLAHVDLGTDGDHRIVYRGVDLAGNESPESSVRIRVDRTPPELVVFERSDPNDPRKVVVAAADRTSGVASGTIEIRPGAGAAASWRPLPTARRGDQFSTTIPDESLKPGIYELRARATDSAGNEALGDRHRDGSPVRVNTATLRAPTRLVAGFRSPSPSGTNRKAAFLRQLTVGYGQRASAQGTLTSVGGRPVRNSSIVVYARAAAAGSAFRVVARVRTNRLGGFSYAVSSGPSRTLRFRYAGSARNRSTQGDVQLRVKAGATIRSDRREARNGDAVIFSGRVRGKPIPRTGKVVDLQAFYRGKWRTFATPRAASPSGKWRYRYRFGATTGKVTYPFRVKVRSESAYPYATGYSKVVKVVVTG